MRRALPVRGNEFVPGGGPTTAFTPSGQILWSAGGGVPVAMGTGGTLLTEIADANTGGIRTLVALAP